MEQVAGEPHGVMLTTHDGERIPVPYNPLHVQQNARSHITVLDNLLGLHTWNREQKMGSGLGDSVKHVVKRERKSRAASIRLSYPFSALF